MKWGKARRSGLRLSSGSSKIYSVILAQNILALGVNQMEHHVEAYINSGGRRLMTMYLDGARSTFEKQCTI